MTLIRFTCFLIVYLVSITAIAAKKSEQQLEGELRTAPASTKKVHRLLILGQQYLERRNFQKVDSVAAVANIIAKNLWYEPGMADFHYLHGLSLEGQLKHQQALDEQRIALDNYFQKKNRNKLGACYLAIGTIFANWGKYDKALTNFYRALGFYEKTMDQRGTARCHLAVGELLSRMDNWYLGNDKGAHECRQALAIFRKIDDRDGVADACHTIGNIYTRMYNYKIIQRYFDEALSIYKANGDPQELALLTTSQGKLHLNKADNNHALACFKNARKTLERGNDKIALSDAFFWTGRTFLALKQLDSALYYFQNTLQLQKEIGDRIKIAITYDWLATANSLNGDPGKAYFFLRKYDSYKVGVDLDHSDEHVRAINARYEAGKRQQRLIALDFRQRTNAERLQEKTNYIYFLTGSVLLLAIITGLVYFQLRNRQRNRLIIAERDRVLEEQKALNYRLQALSSQMNPHFIFNSLTSIQRYVMANDIDNSNRYLGDFSRLMRQTLENSQESTVSLKDELTMLETYLKLEQMRVSDKFDFTISVDATINPERTHIPTLLIQPYAENAIWHGIGDEKMSLDIHLYPNGDLICCSIDDNGVGRPKHVIQKPRKSFGMSITKARLELINLLEEGQVEVQIIDKTDKEGNSLGTRVEICFPADL